MRIIIAVDFPINDVHNQLEVISRVVWALSQESTALNFQQCFDVLANVCSSFNSEQRDRNLTAPSLTPWQVKVNIL